jgi:hypothetical protein
MPCADKDDDMTQHETTTISKTDTHNHQHNQKETCSPFCICACCGVHIPQPQSVEFTFANTSKYSVQQFSNYTFSFQSVQFNIWQPPKLS